MLAAGGEYKGMREVLWANKAVVRVRRVDTRQKLL
jgi:hypothetical protein